MKAFWLGFLHIAIGGALVPVVNAVAHGNLNPVSLGLGAATGAAAALGAYLTPNPKQQQ